MKDNILIIVNPNAGRGNVQKKIHRIASNLSKQGFLVDIIYTKINYSASSIIRDYKGKLDLVICCGGDGTLNDLINAIMNLKEKPQISFIPLGTMNDYANTIGLFRYKFWIPNNMKNAKEIEIDIGKFNNRYFNYVAAFGAFTMVPYVTRQSLKKILGKLAYFIVAIKYFKKIRAYDIEIDVDGNVTKGKFIYGSISNSKSIAGFKWFRKREVSISDGNYEVILVKRPKNKLEFLGIAINIFLKKYNSKYFIYLQGSNIKIKSRTHLNWTIDGEYGGRKKEVEIINNKKALTMVIPK